MLPPHPLFIVLFKGFEALGRILDYKLEIKRLDIEAERVREQARIIGQKIDADHTARLAEIDRRKEECRKILDIAVTELDRDHTNKEALLALFVHLTHVATSDDHSEEARRAARESVPYVSDQLKEYNAKGRILVSSLLSRINPAVERLASNCDSHALTYHCTTDSERAHTGGTRVRRSKRA